MITLYSKNNCMQSKMVKRFLTENQVAFQEINLDEHPEAIDTLKSQGFQTVPVITSTSQTVVGFRPDQLKTLTAAS